MKGNLIIISAPSGTGKSTIVKEIMPTIKRLEFSVSHTSRPPRSGELDGRDYHFVSPEKFQQLIKDNAFLEWAEVHGNFYGTSLAAVEKRLNEGFDILLDIDVQGARQVREAAPEAISIFIIPPSWEVQEQRLRARGTDSDDTIALRLANAKAEISDIEDYDFVMVNDQLSDAAQMMNSIIWAMRAMSRRDSQGLPLTVPAVNP